MKTINVFAARTQQAVLDHQCDEVRSCDTIGEAKKIAKNLLTDDYQRLTEASEPLCYSRIIVNGECLYDYFRKGYNGN